MIKDIISGISNYFKALGLISKLSLWPYFGIPILISLGTGILIIALMYNFSGHLGSLMARIWIWEWGAQSVNMIGQFIAGLLIIVLGVIAYKYIVLALSAPFMGPVSEKIESYMLGSKASLYKNTSFREQLLRSIRINMRNLCRELLFTLPLIALSFVPVIGFVATALIFVTQAYYVGFGNMDCTMERHLDYQESIRFVKQNRGIALGNGIPFVALLFVPILGFIITLPLAVTAASTSTIKRLSQLGIDNNPALEQMDNSTPMLD